MNEEALRYPIGRFSPKPSYSREDIIEGIKIIESLPEKVQMQVSRLSANQLDTPYRSGGWTARQVVHHLADSHTNAYVRFKWSLTEETPLIKAYDEKRWAETNETKLDPAISLNLLKALHAKWVALLLSLDDKDFRREFVHPETQRNIPLERMVALYAWHGEHHLAHLRIVAEKS